MATKNILVVDDDRDLTNSLKAYFEARGYGIQIAHSGSEGMKAIQNARPDLIILDIMMDTDADGFNLAYSLKAKEEYRKIPIIIMSGFMDHLNKKASSFEFVMGNDWPAVEEIKKPASLARIHEAVDRVLA